MEKSLIIDKLVYLKELIKKLDLRIFKFEKETKDIEKETLFLAISKLCEEIVEISIKINNILLEENNDYGPTYYETFIRLKKYYKVNNKLIIKLAKTTSIRNKMTHDYENILISQNLTIINEISNQYKKYILMMYEIIKNE